MGPRCWQVHFGPSQHLGPKIYTKIYQTKIVWIRNTEIQYINTGFMQSNLSLGPFYSMASSNLPFRDTVPLKRYRHQLSPLHFSASYCFCILIRNNEMKIRIQVPK
jgi:hypothetical protein